MAISTNDAWFADSAALYMHNSQSVLRAIENGRYVVRSANTGISSIIDPMGNLNVSLPANEEGYITDNVYMRDHLTVYTVIGNIFVYICAAAVCASFCAEWIIKWRSNMKKL
jgi:apolipoprotein N-acyltransferase